MSPQSASHRSTSASEHSDHSDSEIISSHAESDAEVTRGHSFEVNRGQKTYTRDYLLSFAAKNTKLPSALPNLDFILNRNQNVENLENHEEISEPIRQPRGPIQGKRGFSLKRK